MDSFDEVEVSDEEQRVADEALIARARSIGAMVIEDPHVVIAPEAIRYLQGETNAIGIRVHNGVLFVAVPDILSAAEHARLGDVAGMPIAYMAAPSYIWEQLQLKATEFAADAPRGLGDVLLEAIEAEASDVHVKVGAPPVLRVRKRLVPLEGWLPLTARDVESYAAWISADFSPENGGTMSFSGDMDAAFSYGSHRWRASITRQRRNLAISLRRINNRIPAPEDLGVPEAVIELVRKLRSGLVIVSAPTGEGKSTTLASLINLVNDSRAEHIITLEDPIEYVHEDLLSYVEQREIGDDTPDFPTGIRQAMRQDPDILLIGEMRDNESIRAALTAANTGHLVLATLHAETTEGVFHRIIDGMPSDQRDEVQESLASSLRGVVIQRLVPRCDTEGVQLVCEVFLADDGAVSLMRSKDGGYAQLRSYITQHKKDGMRTLEDALAQHVLAGRISLEEARSRAPRKQSFDTTLEQAQGGIIGPATGDIRRR